MYECKHCLSAVEANEIHECPITGKKYLKSDKDSGDFLTSAVIGAVTGSTIAGTLLGGDPIGAALGDLFFGDDD